MDELGQELSGVTGAGIVKLPSARDIEGMRYLNTGSSEQGRGRRPKSQRGLTFYATHR